MKKLILYILLLTSTIVVAQTPRQLPAFVTGKGTLTQIAAASGTVDIRIAFSDETMMFDGTGLGNTCVLLFYNTDDSRGYELPVTTVVTPSSSNPVIRVNITGFPALNGAINGQGVCYKKNGTNHVTPYVSGITNSLQQVISEAISRDNETNIITAGGEITKTISTLPTIPYIVGGVKTYILNNGATVTGVIGSSIWRYIGEKSTNDLLVNETSGSATIDYGQATKVKSNGDRFKYLLVGNAWIPELGYLTRTTGTMPTVSVTAATGTNEAEIVTRVFNSTTGTYFSWNGSAFAEEAIIAELSIVNSLPASLPKFGNKVIVASGGDTTQYTYIKSGVYKADLIKSSTTPVNTSTTDVTDAVWKNPISLTGKTVDFTYQNNRWFPTKGYVTPQDYDAKGDNTTDDLLAFRAMLKSNYPITIPIGSYKISDSLGINRQLDLVGSGVKITQTTADKAVFYVKVPNCRIYGFELVANFGNASSIYNAFAIISTNARNLKIENNIIHGFGGGGMWLPNAPNAIIRDNLVYDCSSSGLQGEATDIYMWVGSEGAQILNNRCFSNSSQGVYNISGGDELIISGNQCTPKDPTTFVTMDTTLIKRRHGILVSYGAGVVKNVTITNNIVSNTNWTGIYFTGSDSTYNVLISGNVLSRNGLQASNTLSGGIAVFSQPKSLLISNNTIDEYKNIDALVGGITFQPGSISSTLSDSTSCTITGNTVRNSTRALSLGNRATNVIVSNNTFKDFTKGGIDISTLPSTSYVGGYIISNNTFETVSKLGTVGMIQADLQASTKIVELYSNHFRILGTVKDTAIVSNYWSKIKLVGNDFTNLTTACYSGGYISTSLNKDLNNTFKNCINAYDISATSLGAGYYYYKNAYFENVTNIFTNTIGARAIFDKLYNFQEINSGTTITQLESTTNLSIDGYSPLASMAVTLKTAPVDGDVLTVTIGSAYTPAGNTAITGALTFVGGSVVLGDVIPNGAKAKSKVILTYSSSISAWVLNYYPFGIIGGAETQVLTTNPTVALNKSGDIAIVETSGGDTVRIQQITTTKIKALGGKMTALPTIYTVSATQTIDYSESKITVSNIEYRVESGKWTPTPKQKVSALASFPTESSLVSLIGTTLIHSADSASYTYNYVSGIGNAWVRQEPLHATLSIATYDSIVGGVHFLRPTIADNSISVQKKDVIINYNPAQGRYTKPINVRDFGARGDGVTDDLLAFRQASLYAQTYAENKIIIPKGTYILSDSVVFKNINIIGDDQTNTILNFNNNTKGLIVTWTGNYIQRIEIANFTITGAAANQTINEEKHGLSLKGTLETFLTNVHNITIVNFRGSGLYMPLEFNCKIDQVLSSGNGKHGFEVQGGNTTLFTNCYAQNIPPMTASGGVKAGYYSNSGAGNFVSCNGIDSGDCMFMFGDSTTSQQPNFNISSCNIEGNYKRGIYLLNQPMGGSILNTFFQNLANGYDIWTLGPLSLQNIHVSGAISLASSNIGGQGYLKVGNCNNNCTYTNPSAPSSEIVLYDDYLTLNNAYPQFESAVFKQSYNAFTKWGYYINSLRTKDLTIENTPTGALATDTLMLLFNGRFKKYGTLASLTAGNWLKTGNAGTTGANFLGTTDNNPLLLKVNNKDRINLLTGGVALLGNTTDPNSIAQVSSAGTSLKLYSAGQTSDYLNLFSEGGTLGNLYAGIELGGTAGQQGAGVILDSRAGVTPLRFMTNSTGGASTDAMDIFGSQAVQVGTLNVEIANTRFAVKSAGITSATFAAKFQNSAGTDIAAIRSDGNFGLNVSNPIFKIDIDATTGSSGNPIRAQGLLAGARTDSIVTEVNGVFKRLSVDEALGTNFTTTYNTAIAAGAEATISVTITSLTTATGLVGLSWSGTKQTGLVIMPVELTAGVAIIRVLNTTGGSLTPNLTLNLKALRL